MMADAARFGMPPLNQLLAGLVSAGGALLIAASTFAQSGSERAVPEFEELIRREEQRAPASASPVVPFPATPTENLAQLVQAELARVGCDPGAPDGIWGPASRQAAASFNRFGNAQHSTDTPSDDLLRDLRGRGARVCPAEVARTRITTAPPEPTAEPAPAAKPTQNGFWCGPNDTICTYVAVMGGKLWCEPVTTPKARAICPLPSQQDPAKRTRVQPGERDGS